MNTRTAFLIGVALVGVLILPACGGGGGGGGAPVLTIQAVQVVSQQPGPLSPFGTTEGGDEMVITGTAFVTGCTVRVGTQFGAVFQVTSNQVRLTTPTGSEGLATVTVTNPSGESDSLVGTFQFVAPPTVLSVLALAGPTAGEDRAPIAGGVTIEIKGAGFRDGLLVRIDGFDTLTTFVDDTTVHSVVPSTQNDQIVDVSVVNPEGLDGTLDRGLTYTQEFSLDPAAQSIADSEAHHLFRRAAFGAPPARVVQARADGMLTTVDKLLGFTNDPVTEAEALTLYGTSPPPTDGIGFRTNKQWWIHLLVKNPNALQERLAWFLHEHFATSERGFSGNFRWTLFEQINLFRRFSLPTTDTLPDGKPGLGYNWKSLLAEICKDRAMLHWLDGRVSTRFAPNENFAREFWELFTLGEGNNYTENDIQEAARAFTGMRWFTDNSNPNHPAILRIYYRPSLHDATDKTIFGVTGKFGYDSVSPFYEPTPTNPPVRNPAIETDTRDTDGGIAALTLAQRGKEASEFICRKLWEFFVYEDPDDTVIQPLAASLRAPGPNQWNLKPILETMLKSKAMFSARAIKSQIRTPVDFTVGFLRATGIDVGSTISLNTFRIYAAMTDMDQLVLDPPDVNGWPTGVFWLGAQGVLERFNFLAQSVKELDDFTGDIVPLLPPGNSTPSADELVDHISTILDVKLTTNTRTSYVEYVNSEWVGGAQVPFNYDPTNPDHVKLKTRGLIWMIAQYHDAHQN